MNHYDKQNICRAMIGKTLEEIATSPIFLHRDEIHERSTYSHRVNGRYVWDEIPAHSGIRLHYFRFGKNIYGESASEIEAVFIDGLSVLVHLKQPYVSYSFPCDSFIAATLQGKEWVPDSAERREAFAVVPT